MADEIVKVIRIEAQGSEQTVKQLRTEISSLRDVLLNTEKGSEEYKNTVEKLVSNQKKLNDVMAAGKDTFKNSRQELRELKNEMDKLTPGTTEYNAAFQRAAEITHTLQERQEMLKYSAADLGTQLSNVVSIGSSLAAGFNAVQGVLALTGSKSEELQKTMMKLQAGIALVQGLQGLEGMTKKMRGFINGVTEMVFHTNAATTAVAAETTAIGANTTAQEANAVATNAATVATNGFKKALISTGIGAIIVLIGSLIAHWEDLKDMIGLSNEQLDAFNAVMDRIKVTIAGVSEVIYQAFISSIKNLITAVTGLGKVLKDAFTLDFKQLAKDAKETWDKIGDNTKKGLDVVNNYREGAAKKQAKIDEKRKLDAIKASAEELNELIKDNEAKYGSEWKYTQEGKKLYDEYFATKLSAYKKDSQEYREINRQKMAYDREYAEHFKKASTSQVKQAKEVADTQIKEAERVLKRAQDYSKDEIELLTEKYEEEKALLEKYHMDTLALEKEYQDKLAKIKAKRAADAAKEAAEAAAKAASEAMDQYSRQLDSFDRDTAKKIDEINDKYDEIDAKRWGGLSAKEIQKKADEIYEAQKSGYEKEAAAYDKMSKDMTLTEEDRTEAQQRFLDMQDSLLSLARKKRIDDEKREKEEIEEKIQLYRGMGEALGQVFGSIADMMENDIKTKVKNGEITEEEGKRQFENVKKFQIAEATINTISGAVAAYMSGVKSKIPAPGNVIFGAAQAALVTAAGVAQILKIKNTQLGASSSVSSAAAAAAVPPQPEEYVPQYTQNATGESEITNLASSIRDQRVILVESDVTAAQEKAKRVRVESTW